MKKHAVLIGINGYSQVGGLNDLRYARQDAVAVAGMLKRCYGFTDDEITLVTDDPNGKIKPFDRFALESVLQPSRYESDLDLFLFGFWGHGIWMNNQRFLCPMNVRE